MNKTPREVVADMLPGTMLRSYPGANQKHDGTGKPFYFKKPDGWHKTASFGGGMPWVIQRDMTDQIVLDVFLAGGEESEFAVSFEPEFKSYPFQKVPDLELPQLAELSGEQMNWLADAKKQIQTMADMLTMQSDQNEELMGVGRLVAFLDNAASCIGLAMYEDPKSPAFERGPTAHEYGRVTNLWATQDPVTHVFKVLPYDQLERQNDG